MKRKGKNIMFKNLIAKLFTVSLITTSFLILISNHIVEATSSESTESTLDKISEVEEKIMEYDVITGETKEVNMEKLRQTLKASNYIQNADSISTNVPISLNSSNVTRTAYTSSSVTLPGVTLITNRMEAPYKYTCRVVCDPEGDIACYGTAALVAPNLAITAAHNIWDKDNNYRVRSDWTIYPGFYENSYLNGASGWSKVYYSNLWQETGKNEYDWAICVLNNDLGTSCGFYPTRSYTYNLGLYGRSVSVVGYPGDYMNWGFDIKARYPYQFSGKINQVENNWFAMPAYCCIGFSGSPIFESDGVMVGILIASSLDSSITYGVRITSSMIDIISSHL